MKKIIFLLLISHFCFSQNISGTIFDKQNKPIPGVYIYWENKINTTVISDTNGKFSINPIDNSSRLIFRALGFKNDTINPFEKRTSLFFMEEESSMLNEVTVSGNANFIDKLSAIKTEVITSKALLKAACCNLSESFETNASISVSYSDAVTGAKQIQLLGLSGIYVQTNLENIPQLRGLSSTFGLNYVPGTWIQSIDIGKGIGSAVNGYENIGGVLNVELQKPDNSEKLYVNGYLNNFGRGELNLNISKKINKKWSTALLSHGSLLKSEIDNNGDGFLDLTNYDQINILNRWKYSGDKLVSQFGIRGLVENRLGGQNQFKSREQTPTLYGFTNNTQRLDVFTKTAKLFPDAPYRGIGLILNASMHKSNSYFGFKPYLASQNTLYGNLIYQDKIINTNHTYKTGLSFLNDNYDEEYTSIQLKRNEIVPGAFFEYTFNHLDRTILLLGLRNDFHNLFGNQFSPRLHFKQDIGQNDTWRLSAGRGFRVPTPLAEYYGNLVSSRTVRFLDDISPEIGWTLGTSCSKTINKLSLNAELYHTIFTHQWIADLEHLNFIYFYSSESSAFTTSGLIEANYGPVKNWEFKLAYRYVNSKQSLGKPLNEQVLVDRMYVSRDRILFNVAYALPYDKWKIDATLQWNGKRRIPNLTTGYDHSSYFRMPIGFSPAFSNLNAQITRTFINWDFYLGGENLAGFRQTDPILFASDPFGNGFDAGMAWGPVVGATIYSGFRFKIR
jgi:outer membrane receptor for ferrienterochelin and colicins